MLAGESRNVSLDDTAIIQRDVRKEKRKENGHHKYMYTASNYIEHFQLNIVIIILCFRSFIHITHSVCQPGAALRCILTTGLFSFRLLQHRAKLAVDPRP